MQAATAFLTGGEARRTLDTWRPGLEGGGYKGTLSTAEEAGHEEDAAGGHKKTPPTTADKARYEKKRTQLAMFYGEDM